MGAIILRSLIGLGKATVNAINKANKSGHDVTVHGNRAFVKQGKNYVQLSGKDKTTFLETGNVPDVKTTTKHTGAQKNAAAREINPATGKTWKQSGGTKKYLEWVEEGRPGEVQRKPPSEKGRTLRANIKAVQQKRATNESLLKSASSAKTSNTAATIVKKLNSDIRNGLILRSGFRSWKAWEDAGFKGIRQNSKDWLEFSKSRKTKAQRKKQQREDAPARLAKAQEEQERIQKQILERLDITPVEEGTSAFKNAPAAIKNILRETQSQRNLRQTGELDPYGQFGKYYHARPTEAVPIRRTESIYDEGGEGGWRRPHYLEKEIDPVTGKLTDRLVRFRQERGDIPLSKEQSIMAERDPITGIPVSKHIAGLGTRQEAQLITRLKHEFPDITDDEIEGVIKAMGSTGRAKVPSGAEWRGTEPSPHEIRTPVETPGTTPAKYNPETGRLEEPYLGILQQKTPRTLEPSARSQTRKVLRTRSEAPAFPSGEVSREMGQRGSQRFFPERELGEGSIFQRDQSPSGFYDPRKTFETGYPTRRGGIADILEQRRLYRRAQKLRGFGAQEDLRQTAIGARQKLPTSKAAEPSFRPTEIPRGLSTPTVTKPISPKVAERFRKQAAEFRDERNKFRQIVQSEVEKNPLRVNVREKAWKKIRDSEAWKKYIKGRTKLKNEINKKAPNLKEFEPYEITRETIGPRRQASKRLGIEGESPEQYLEKLYDVGKIKPPTKKLVDSFKKGNIIARKSGGQLKKPRGWGAARYRK
tara:strand:- start:229 stop:2505 length:2277 start_codon:yes stop_codon:yes gene_type:complete